MIRKLNILVAIAALPALMAWSLIFLPSSSAADSCISPGCLIERENSKDDSPFSSDDHYRTSAKELELLKSGDLSGYYNSRLERGDRYASLALDVVDNEGILGRAANIWLWQKVVLLSDEETEELLGGRTYREFANSVSQGLAEAHRDAVDNDDDGIPGILSANQISQYHEDYFTSLGLPASTFGGSAIFGFRTKYWCKGCDTVP